MGNPGASVRERGGLVGPEMTPEHDDHVGEPSVSPEVQTPAKRFSRRGRWVSLVTLVGLVVIAASVAQFGGVAGRALPGKKCGPIVQKNYTTPSQAPRYLNTLDGACIEIINLPNGQWFVRGRSESYVYGDGGASQYTLKVVLSDITLLTQTSSTITVPPWAEQDLVNAAANLTVCKLFVNQHKAIQQFLGGSVGTETVPEIRCDSIYPSFFTSTRYMPLVPGHTYRVVVSHSFDMLNDGRPAIVTNPATSFTITL